MGSISSAPWPSQPPPRVVQQHSAKPFYAATREVKDLPFGSSCWFVSAVQTHCHCEYIYGTLGSTKYTLTMKLLCPAATTTRRDHGAQLFSCDVIALANSKCIGVECAALDIFIFNTYI